jgi:hypothetical protein
MGNSVELFDEDNTEPSFGGDPVEGVTTMNPLSLRIGSGGGPQGFRRAMNPAGVKI